MGIVRNFIRYAKKISLENEGWQVAIRPKLGVPLYKGNAKDFYLVPNNIRYWRADPFVIKYDNKNYLFVEMYDRKTKKGVIGVAKIKNGKCGRFTVCLDMPHHLSYPCIYEENNDIYMIPECYESKEINVYKAIEFPYKWRPVEKIKSISAVDTTPFINNKGSRVFFTSLYEPEFGGNDNLYAFEEGKSGVHLFLNNTSVRSAGHIIKDNKDVIRPSQDDTGHYGNSLIFSVIDSTDLNDYHEHEILRVLPPGSCCCGAQECISLINNYKGIKFLGVHTYNSNEDYEVIDLKYANQSNLLLLWQNRNKLLEYCLKKIK